jgi:hypothetical protein
MAEAFDPYHRWLGIPPEEQPPHHYRLLGIAVFEDQPEVIEHAADRQMAHLRTFQVGPHAGLSQKLLNEVAAAKLCLLRAEKKAAYDNFLRGRLAGSKPSPAPAGEPPPFPVVPPDEESAVVELGVPGEEPSATSPIVAALRRRWRVIIAGIVAVGLVLGIVTLAAMLAPPAPPAVDGPAQVEQPVAAVSGQGDTAEPARSTSSDPGPPALPRPADDEISAEELAFWESLLEGESEPAETIASTPPKPKESVAAAVPAKSEVKMPSASAQPSTAAAQMPKPADVSARPSPSPPEPPPKRAELKPEPFKTAAQIDPLLAEAWTLIRRGDHVKGRDKLAQASKISRADLRVQFSLGLVDALVTLDWAAAEKEFSQCVQEHPKHIASLNNLALVRLRLGREPQWVRQWQTVLAEGPPPDEVVQNLGRVRYLSQKARLSLKPVTQKAVTNLYVDAQRTGNARFDEGVGFLYMGLYGGGNPEFGWTERHDYEDRWCAVCNARGNIKCPQRDCKNGTVQRMSSKVVGFHPITKAPISVQSPIPMPCTMCNKSGFITCPYCTNGKDKLLK